MGWYEGHTMDLRMGSGSPNTQAVSTNPSRSMRHATTVDGANACIWPNHHIVHVPDPCTPDWTMSVMASLVVATIHRSMDHGTSVVMVCSSSLLLGYVVHVPRAYGVVYINHP